MEVSGKIKVLKETQTVGTSGFKKREVVIRTEEQYPQPLMIELTQDKTNLIDAYKVGDNVTISINIRGREWTSPKGEVKYFTSLQGWRIQGAQAAQPTAASTPPPSFDAPGKPDFSTDEADDDLPF